MAGEIGIIIEGDRSIEQRFDQFPQTAHRNILARFRNFMPRLAALVRAQVPKKTGKLASEVVETIRDTPEKISGRVGFSAEFAKAGALEYGGTGKSFKVGAHEMRLDHVFRNRLSAPERVMVEAHSRATHMAARRFIRGAKSTMDAEIVSELRQAVSDTIEQGQ